jgi:hypothetical protein
MKTKTIKCPKNREALAKEPEDTVNFPCAESLSPFHHQKLIAEMELYPADVMTRRYCRKIPFKGTKSLFYETTAREHFTGTKILQPQPLCSPATVKHES